MYKLCKTEQSAHRQKEIESVLLELMASTRYEDITVTELCENMQMPRKAFYRYFDSKEDTLRALIEHTLCDYDGFKKMGRELDNRTLKGELDEYFEFWRSKRELLDALERNGLMGTLVDCAVNYPIGNIIDIRKFFSHLDGFSEEMLMHFIFSGLVYVMIEWYRRGFDPSVSEMSDNVARIFTMPLFSNLDSNGIKTK
jgi:AcrR family transcriptional regulator